MKMIFNDRVYDFVTIGGLAKKCGRSVSYMRKLIERGVLPEANIRTVAHEGPVKTVEGYRLYLCETADKVSEILKTMHAGVKISVQQRDAINDAFMQEKITLKL